jgi:hypothetical protein
MSAQAIYQQLIVMNDFKAREFAGATELNET